MKINENLSIPDAEIAISATRSQGAGGQNVNKVSTAAHLRFDIQASSLPEEIKNRLMARKDRRITREGTIVIKAQRHRTQEKNRIEALNRLRQMIQDACKTTPPRKKTKPSKTAQVKRLEGKTRRGRIKALRKKVDYEGRSGSSV